MQHEDSVFLRHILDMAAKVLGKIRGRSRTDLDSDEDFRDALAHRVQVIGEAAAHLSPFFRDAHPEIPWHRAIGMRHRIVHDYMNVDNDLLWEVATRSLPELISFLAPLVTEEKP